MISIHRPAGSALNPRKPRLIASLALGAVVLLGTTGCAMLSTQATTLPYSPADGVNVPDSGPLEVRNALLVTNEEGEDANFLAAIINSSDETQTLHLEFGEENPIEETVRVPAHTTVSLGVTEDALLIEGIDAPAGSDVLVYFQSGDAEGVQVAVPVLDGALDYLAPFVP
ncbi:DNA modification methylase [Microbacterium sp. SS28]|uniref:DNA modification methylase n=1 Tax=Microbacterium sp. SS28 TaxID=2919948 RepID=UPI001FAA6A06|nr:DNA modification methylase [Microbacterium sp. SS28]